MLNSLGINSDEIDQQSVSSAFSEDINSQPVSSDKDDCEIEVLYYFF